MIRPAAKDDAPLLLALARETAMFSDDELETFAGMFREYADGALGPGHAWIVVEEEGLQAAAYYAPEMMSDGVWNLYFIGVRGAARRRGDGEALVAETERALREGGARMLLVETSSIEQFVPARRFYAKNGFDEEARIRDFYGPGQDKVIFRKSLL